MWKNMGERGRPQTKIWRVRIACWILKATHKYTHTHTHTHTQTHSAYVIFIVFQLQQCLHERQSMLRYTHIACTVCVKTNTYWLLIYRKVSYCSDRTKLSWSTRITNFGLNSRIWIDFDTILPCGQPHLFDTRRFGELTFFHRQGIRFPDDAVLECIRTPGHVFLTDAAGYPRRYNNNNNNNNNKSPKQ